MEIQVLAVGSADCEVAYLEPEGTDLGFGRPAAIIPVGEMTAEEVSVARRRAVEIASQAVGKPADPRREDMILALAERHRGEEE